MRPPKISTVITLFHLSAPSFDDSHMRISFSFYKIIASANYMLSELFQLDEPKKEESSESPLNENSDESYSEEEEEMPDSDENGSYGTSADPPDDNKAVAIIKSVGELSVPEKYKSIHQIRVSMLKCISQRYQWKNN